jgi:hypothetical protein
MIYNNKFSCGKYFNLHTHAQSLATLVNTILLQFNCSHACDAVDTC